MPYDPILQVFGDDPEALKEFERIKALRGDVSAAKRMQKLGAAAALATDEGLRNIGDNFYRTGVSQEDRYKEAMAQGYEGLKQTRSRAKEREEEKAWREQQRADEQAYRAQTLALQRQQEARLAAQGQMGQWDVVPDPVRGGFVRINKRTGEMEPVNLPGMQGTADTSGLPPSGIPVAQPGGKPPSESEAKTGMRAGVGVSALQQLQSLPAEARMPGKAETAANFFGLPAAQQNFMAGLFGGPERLLAKGAQDQFIDQALTEMTGAAYTEHQLNAFRSAYLPTAFDDDRSKAEKMNRAYQYVRQQAQAAGRAWTPQRDMEFRQLMLSLSGGQPPGGVNAPTGQAQGMSPPGTSRDNPIVLD